MDPTRPAQAPQDLLARGFAELGLPVAAQSPVLEALVALARHVVAWASRLNLTGHRSLDDVLEGLILEAVALHAALPPAPSLADIGSGAGFPGLPLAILRPEARVTLVESRERRHHFQRFAIRELGLSNVVALRGRAELLEPTPHAIALAQAAAPPAQVLPWLARWLEPGGLAVIPGGATPPRPPASPFFPAPRVAEYRVPSTEKRRTLWLARYRP